MGRGGYNSLILIRRALVFAVLFGCTAAAQQQRPPEALTVVVMPFENESRAPGLEWIGEAFPEVLGQRLASTSIFVISRDDRLYAFDRLGIPANLRPSRSTLYRIAEEMDADFAILGHFQYDGQTFSGSAQALDLKRLHLLPEVRESGPLPNLLDLQNALAWDLMTQLQPRSAGSRTTFLAQSPAVRLDAFENYSRGIIAQTRPEKIQRFREAVRLNPSYAAAILQLGRTYYAGRDYENAALWLDRVPRTDAAAREAGFYQGMSYYYLGQFDKAETAFSFVASRLPLTEIYNNLGVVAARRRHNAVDYFQKAADADPGDADYRFNLALALVRAGDSAGAMRQLREALSLRPSDSEARSLLDLWTGAGRASAANLPLERVKRNYDEASFRQLAFEIESATEMKLAQADPATHARVHVDQGRQMLAEGFKAEAEKLFREAVVLDPANAAAHAGLAETLEAGADAAAARAEAMTAIQLQPSATAYLVLARLDLRDNKVQAASDNADHALALEPANSAALALKREIAVRLPGGAAQEPRP